MKKKIIYMILAFMLMGCSKSVDIPKLKAKELTYEYGEKVSLELENLVDVSDYTKDQIKELEKNGEVDTSELIYDDDGNIVPGTYKVEISYYSDVVETTIMITTEDESSFEHTEIENIDVEQGDTEFDFSAVITITSKYDFEVTVTYDTSEIQFDVPGVYTLHVKAVDTAENEMDYDYQVTIIEKEESEEETEEESTETTEDTTQQTTTVTQQTTTVTQPATTTAPVTQQSPAATTTPSTPASQVVTPTPTPTPDPTPVTDTTGSDSTSTEETPADPTPSTDQGTTDTGSTEDSNASSENESNY